MITETEYIAYFQGLASKHKQIRDGIDKRVSFFFIPAAMDLTEIDNQLRGDKATPLIALDAMTGRFDDIQSDSHTQYIAGQFTILDKVKTGEAATIRAAQDNCLKIGLQILTRMKLDSRANAMINTKARFTIHNAQYDPVGPMALLNYGYTFRFSITCPFGFTVDSGNWLDK